MSKNRGKFERIAALLRDGNLDSAAAAAAASLRASPKDPNVLHLAAQIAEAQGEPGRAAVFYRRALEAHPCWPEAMFNLAAVLNGQGQHEEALALMTEVSRQRPRLQPVWEALAKFSQSSGKLPEAIAHWEHCLSLSPSHSEARAQILLLKRQLCDWSGPSPDIDPLPPQAVTVLSDDSAAQMASAVEYARRKFGNLSSFPKPAWTPHERLRVGYLSSDFHAHATAFLMAELFGLHDHDRFEVFAYSYGADDESPIRARIKEQAEHFIELNKLSAEQAARRLREDEIDILVDLKGHTRGSRLAILAYRPAPVQIHWLGYPGTTGAPFIDYFIGDGITIPEGNEAFFTEKVIRLPRCYQINDRQRPAGDPLPRESYGLPEKAFVFASFNQTYKITPEMFALWCGLLRETKDSVLWLYESNPYAPERLRSEAQKQDVDPSRLVFAPPLSLDQHLARYAHVDLALDTFPVGGHTTTSDALWTGTPVVTLAGNSFVSRVAASLLNAAEQPQLVTSAPDAYRDLALNLFRNTSERRRLKEHLVSRRFSLPLFDTPGFVKDWEDALLRMNLATVSGP